MRQLRKSLAISLFVDGRRAVVIGSGQIAAERAARLTEAGADVHAITENDYDAGVLAGAAMVMLCDDALSTELAARVRADARAEGAMMYAQDRPDLSDFAMPALIRRGPVRVAISTEGTAPALARRLREELERVLEPQLAEFAEAVARDRRNSTETVAGLRIDGKLVIPDRK